uniref:Uncharacterized protein n=1 Tax=Arundo donax TaxID=35708 RepID=A0A0A9FWZ5_ARUDO
MGCPGKSCKVFRNLKSKSSHIWWIPEQVITWKADFPVNRFKLCQGFSKRSTRSH